MEIQLDDSVDDSKQPKPNWALVAVGAVVIVAGAALCFVCPPAGAGAVAAGTALVSAATVTTVILGALAFGLIAAGTNLMLQGFAGTDWQDIDWASFAVETAVGAVTGALGRLFTAAVSAGKIAGTAAKILAGVKYGVSVLLQSFGAYASVMISTGDSVEAWKAFGFAFVISLAVGSLELIGDLKAVNKVGQSGGVIENKVDNAVKEVPSENEIKAMRAEASQRAKAQEIEYLKAQKAYFEKYNQLPNNAKAWGTAQNLSVEQVDMILENGKFPSIYDGHHIKSVKFAKGHENYASIADPNNIVIGHRIKEHFKFWHKGKWANQSDSVFINNVRITSINRNALIKKIFKSIGRK